uniref:Uncharacterized protein n=1 Tax=Bicosoecida sp. CB-2014 TaxID=1486930 RepID=A0A7S1CFC3_9STRA|mmetsp:Transcript_23311/g.81245  ORF Transcript_23311/g.81245 Transcript_23311/m.81245 type:complete len:291 (+) Transcript_23311:274-1146(+)
MAAPDPLQEAHLFLGNLLDLCSLISSLREDDEVDEAERKKQEAAEKKRFFKLGGSYKAHLYAFAYVDNVGDSMFDSVKDILQKLTRQSTPFLKLYFEVFAEIIVKVSSLTDEERAAEPTPASVRGHLERVAVAKRMWEFREALKAEILDVRADAESEVAEVATEEADMLEERTAALKVATEQFRDLKNTTRDFLRTSVTILDKQTAETKEATKQMDTVMDSRLSEHDKQIAMLGYGVESVDLLVEAQQTMLSYRVCGMCLVDRRMLRRQCYICFGFVMICLTVYGIFNVM